jgi:hypothetical protein
MEEQVKWSEQLKIWCQTTVYEYLMSLMIWSWAPEMTNIAFNRKSLKNDANGGM